MESKQAARAALTTYCEHPDARSTQGPEVAEHLITDILEVATRAGINTGMVMERVKRTLMEQEEAEEADVAHATVTLRVVCYGPSMDRDELRQLLPQAIENLALTVHDEDGAEDLAPWVRVETVKMSEQGQ